MNRYRYHSLEPHPFLWETLVELLFLFIVYVRKHPIYKLTTCCYYKDHLLLHGTVTQRSINRTYMHTKMIIKKGKHTKDEIWKYKVFHLTAMHKSLRVNHCLFCFLSQQIGNGWNFPEPNRVTTVGPKAVGCEAT